jgi:hypothetical protein
MANEFKIKNGLIVGTPPSQPIQSIQNASTAIVYDASSILVTGKAIYDYVSSISGVSTLSGLSDVSIVDLSSNQLLQYDFATSKWKNISPLEASLYFWELSTALLRESSLGISFYWDSGYLEASGTGGGGGVSQAYVDGSLVLRDISILWLQNNKADLTDLNPYATNSSVGLAGFLKSADLNSYATNSSVGLAIAPFATNVSVGTALSTLNSSVGTALNPFATNASIGLAGFLKNADLNPYATNSSVGLALGPYATNSSVNSALNPFATNSSVGLAIQNFATNSSVNTALGAYATNSSIGLAGFLKSADLNSYATNSSVGLAIAPFATNSSVGTALTNLNSSVGTAIAPFATNASVNTALGSYATNASIGTAAFAKNASLALYVQKVGDTMTGPLTISAGGLSVTNDVSVTGGLYVNSDANIKGNLTINGSLYVVNVESIDISTSYIKLNSGLTSAPPSSLQSGVIVGRGTSDPYVFVYDETQQTFRIGIATLSGATYNDASTQAVATREDFPTSWGIGYWNAGKYRVDTSIGFIFTPGVGLGLPIATNQGTEKTVLSLVAGVVGSVELGTMAFETSTNYYGKDQVDVLLYPFATNSSVGLAIAPFATNASIGLAGFLKSADLNSYATNASIGLAGFLKSADLNSYATNSSVGLAIAPFATNSSVGLALSPYATNASIGTAAFAKNASLGLYVLKAGDTMSGALNISSGGLNVTNDVSISGNAWVKGMSAATGANAVYYQGDGKLTYGASSDVSTLGINSYVNSSTYYDGSLGYLKNHLTLSEPSSGLGATDSQGIYCSFVAGAAIPSFSVGYVDLNGRLSIADADASNNMPSVAINTTGGTLSAGTSYSLLIYGIVRNTSWSLTIGKPVYVSGTGTVTSTRPTTATQCVQVIGTAISPSAIIFNPSPDFIVLK